MSAEVRMIRTLIAAFAVLAVAACSGGEQPKSDRVLATEAMKHAETKDVVAVFFKCLEGVAPKTPNGKDALDLDRINNVIKACQSEEEAMKAKVTEVFGKTTSQRQMQGRFDGLTEEAWKVIRAHPFVPPTGSLPESP
jgi:hypothetical protein